jgi:integrase
MEKRQLIAKLVRRGREKNVRLRWLLGDKEQRLRAIVDRDYPEHMPEFEIALHTGMRRGEQYGLRWEDVNLSNRTATIHLSKHGETRHVRLNSVALAAFQKLFERSNTEGFVFASSRSERLLGPRHWFEPAVESAKIPNFTWHCLGIPSLVGLL